MAANTTGSDGIPFLCAIRREQLSGSPVSVRTPLSDDDWSGHCLIQVLGSVDNLKANYMTDWGKNFTGSLCRLAPLRIPLNATTLPLRTILIILRPASTTRTIPADKSRVAFRP